jgi:SAM-dependent methyltransferase
LRDGGDGSRHRGQAVGDIVGFLALVLRNVGDISGSDEAWALAMRLGLEGNLLRVAAPIDMEVAMMAAHTGRDEIENPARKQARTPPSAAAAAERAIMNERFRRIYESRVWVNGQHEHPASGGGSTLEATAAVRSGLQQILDLPQLSISSMLDIGCGDMTWLPSVPRIADGTLQYHGLDVVPALVERNRQRHPGLEFSVLDTVVEPLPRAYDLVLIKDVVIHLKLRDILAMLASIEASGSRFLMIMHDPTLEESSNSDTSFNAMSLPAGYRRINLFRPPFSLADPQLWFPAQTAPDDPSVMGLWRLPLARNATRRALDTKDHHQQQVQNKHPEKEEGTAKPRKSTPPKKRNKQKKGTKKKTHKKTHKKGHNGARGNDENSGTGRASPPPLKEDL